MKYKEGALIETNLYFTVHFLFHLQIPVPVVIFENVIILVILQNSSMYIYLSCSFKFISFIKMTGFLHWVTQFTLNASKNLFVNCKKLAKKTNYQVYNNF